MMVAAHCADGPDEPGVAPEMFWMAKRFNAAGLMRGANKRIWSRSTHPDAYDLAWFDRDAKPPQPPAWPLDAVFHGVERGVVPKLMGGSECAVSWR